MAPNNPFKPGDQLYKYQLKSYIGGGNYGNVWLATDNSVNSEKAIKILDSSMASLVDPLNEARIGNHLEHQNLVKIDYADVVNFELNGISKQYVIIAMDYYPKGSILGCLNSKNFVKINESIQYIINLLSGLEYLHENGYYHGDIKPQNILIGSRDEAILSDYGISRIVQKCEPVVAPQFYILHAAPETILQGIFSIQTEIYQVGITFYRLLNGIGTIKAKFNSLGKVAFYEEIINGKLISSKDYLPFIPTKLRSIIQKAIHLESTNRYNTALEMRRDLEQLHYPGYWTTDSNGNYIGSLHNYLYSFETSQCGNNSFNFIAWKENVNSKQKTRVTHYCLKKTKKEQLEKNLAKYMQSVVQGSINSQNRR